MEESNSTREALVRAVGESVLSQYMDDSFTQFRQPFGSVSKSQIDGAIFSALVEGGFIAVDDRPFQVGVKLRITPARVKNLIFAHRLRHASRATIDPQHIQVDLTQADGESLVLIIDDLFTREALLVELRQRAIYPKRDVEAARLKVEAESAIETLKSLLGADETTKLKSDFEKSQKPVLDTIRRDKAAPYLTEVFGAILSMGATAFFASLGIGQ